MGPISCRYFEKLGINLEFGPGRPNGRNKELQNETVRAGTSFYMTWGQVVSSFALDKLLVSLFLEYRIPDGSIINVVASEAIASKVTTTEHATNPFASVPLTQT